jgi:hypothetical protein
MEKQGLLGRRQSEQRGLANMRHLRCVAQRMLQRNVMRRESGRPHLQLSCGFSARPNTRIMSGHDSGTITPTLAEADDVERERWHSQMGEPYRTLLGHFRHEVGHCFWDRSCATSAPSNSFVEMFGDYTAITMRLCTS